MRDIIRSGQPGRCALAYIGFMVSMAVCMGQSPPPVRASATPPATEATTPPVNPAEAPPVNPAEAPPAKAAEATPVQAAPAEVKQAVAKATETVAQPVKGKAIKGGKPSGPSGPGEATAIGVQDKPYVIGPEDVLGLNVLHVPDVSQQLNVRPDGFITVRFAGEIKAAGLTPPELSDIITEKLTTYFNHPEVNIQVMQIRSKKYYISGEVRKPGSYTLSTPKTILEAIIEAGGPTEFGKAKRIYVLRGQQKIPFNYSDASKGRNLKQNILLQNGDVIYIP
jgi:polysaccharide export outer membrane protein